MKKYQKVQRLASNGTTSFAACNGDYPRNYCGPVANYKAR